MVHHDYRCVALGGNDTEGSRVVALRLVCYLLLANYRKAAVYAYLVATLGRVGGVMMRIECRERGVSYLALTARRDSGALCR